MVSHANPARKSRLLRAADAAGRFVNSAARTVPGVVGAGLVCFGLGLVYRPLLFLAVGGFLLVLDRRT